MAQVRFRSAVSPLRRGTTGFRRSAPAVRKQMTCVDNLVETMRPADPVHCLRPAVLSATAARFVAAFPGDVLYAVKCNPEPAVLRALYEGGVRHFDCASPGRGRAGAPDVPERRDPLHAPGQGAAARSIRPISTTACATSRSTARKSWKRCWSRRTAPSDLGLFVRLALPKGSAVYDLSGKFGAAVEDAAALLRAARAASPKIGICFHVGSQCLDPSAYERAMALAGEVIAQAGVAVDVLDVGGGFPVSYPGVTPPPLGDFMAAIARGFAKLALPARTRLWCEPGRALVAPGGRVVVQVTSAAGHELYINDGVYGSLSDAGVPAFRFPARLIRPTAAGCGSAGTGASRSTARPATAPTTWRVRSCCRPISGGRLDRARPARRLWRLPAHRLQRLRPRPPGRGDRPPAA